jgi:hypothetical protein
MGCRSKAAAKLTTMHGKVLLHSLQCKIRYYIVVLITPGREKEMRETNK